MKQTEILVKSTLDGTMQPSLFYKSPNANRPLLVGLHTWSYDRFNQIENMLPFAEKNDFNQLLPEFLLKGSPEYCVVVYHRVCAYTICKHTLVKLLNVFRSQRAYCKLVSLFKISFDTSVNLIMVTLICVIL